MEVRIAKCVRCGKPFGKIHTPICEACLPDEEADYERISDALHAQPGLRAPDLAEKAEATLACVRRMIEAGRVMDGSVGDDVKCGRCGAPAISASKRLCNDCLGKLDQECAEALREMRQKMIGEEPEAGPVTRETLDKERLMDALKGNTKPLKQSMFFQDRKRDLDKDRR